MDVLEIDPNFEPQARARSNTWPLRPKEFTKEDENRSTPTSTEGDSTEQSQKDLLGFTKAKTSSRRNAWGNLSYADLITKAIESTPDKRLTLSQIYDWMVQNVPFFKDKGDSNSSAGWKNSIRHNLSLHNRFMRMQNEGTGKSSWWVINPDAKPGKSPRRRATSMDTKSFEKKRGRVKKMVEAKRAALAEAASHGSLPGSECGDSSSDILEPFSLSPQDFRNRTSSNASSLGGRLSPIQAGVEPDLHDNQVPPMSSPIPWIPSGKPCGPSYQTPETYPMSTETLSESLAEMFMGDLSPESCGMGEALSNSQMSTPSPLQPQLSPAPSYPETSASYLPAPPPYPDQQMRRSPNPQSPMVATNLAGIGAGMSNGIITTMGNNTIAGTGMGGMSSMISNLASAESNRGLVNTSLSELLADSQEDILGMPPTTMAVNQQFRNSAFQNQNSPSARLLAQQRNLLASNPSLLRQALTNKAQQLQASQMQASQMQMAGGGIQSQNGLTGLSPQQPLTQQQQQQSMQPDLHPSLLNGGVMQTTACVTMMDNPEPAFGSVQGGLFPGLPSDLDLNYEDMRPDDLDCDVDQIIKHELSLDNNLDFDFETGQTAHDQFGSIQT